MMKLSRLTGDESGAAAAELALVLPVVLVLMMGALEAVQMVEAQRKVAHVASAVADIVAQDRTISDAELSDVFLAGGLLMAPFPAASLGQRVTSFVADDKGQVRVRWTASAAPYAGTEPLALQPGALKANQSLIVADVSYDYRTGLAWVLPGELKMQKRAYLTPRVSAEVIRRAGS